MVLVASAFPKTMPTHIFHCFFFFFFAHVTYFSFPAVTEEENSTKMRVSFHFSLD